MSNKLSSAWVRVEDDAYRDRILDKSLGITTFGSEYDFPESLRQTLDVDGNDMLLELRYVADEVTRRVRLSSDTVVHVGRNSGRLYDLKISGVDFSRNSELFARIKQAILKLGKWSQYSDRANNNYAMALKALSENWITLSNQTTFKSRDID